MKCRYEISLSVTCCQCNKNFRTHVFIFFFGYSKFRRINSTSGENKYESTNNSMKLPINPLAPNDVYIRRTARLTSRRCILNIYSKNIITEHFKHAAHSPFFFSSRCRLFHNPTFFCSRNIHILNTGCAKI